MILVTGSTSLLGTSLVQKLIDDGQKVRCLDFEKPRDLQTGIEFIESDILDEIVLKKLCRDVDVVFHLLDVKSPKRYGRRYMKKINVKGTRFLLKAASFAGVKKVIFLSSYEVYGKKEKMPILESAPKKPVTRYGKDKWKAEKLCQAAIKERKMDITIFRPAPLVGAHTKNPITLITLLMAMGMEEDNRIYVAGNGENRFQLLHPQDAAQAFFLAYKSGLSRGKIYNIGSDNVPTQMEQVLAVKDKAKLDSAIMHLSSSKTKFLSVFLKPFKVNYLNKGHVMYLLSNLILDCQAARSDLKWMPKRGNVDSVLETIEWYKKEKL